MQIFTRDVTQAYVQSEMTLERDVYIDAPPEMQLPDDSLLKVVLPLYGIPESGLDWYLTYTNHHMEHLGMFRATVDPCVLIRREKGNLAGLVIHQVDDSMATVMPRFLDDEERASSPYKSKPRQMLTETPTIFNGSHMQLLSDGTITISQPDKIALLLNPDTENAFFSQKAMPQYVAFNGRPDVMASVQLIAPGNEPATEEEFKILKKIIMHLKSTHTVELTYRPIEIATVRLILFMHASFGNARRLKSQFWLVHLIADEEWNAKILHYSSLRCRRVTRSVMTSRFHALVLVFDQAFSVRHLI